MSDVDNKVVRMQFDNSNFEKNANASISTLDKLKEKLNFTESTKSVANLDKEFNSMNFSNISKSVEVVSDRFSNLGIIGMRVLQNIADSAYNAGKKLLKAFTVDPVHTGFGEYELKMGAVQTIMASTGDSIETVNGYLQELNEYSDKTIYSFGDMQQNIGKFTNAGVDLNDAVKAIKGISNEAAVSGANAQEASRAMYNFAQALSAGSVKLIDWKSIENANMATVEFKNQLINTAVELGTLRKVGDKYVSTTTNIQGKTSEAFDATKMFNESLNHQWMTTDVLVKTLGNYADETTDIGKKAFSASQDVKTFSMMMDTLKEAAQSGWSETWEIMVGDLETAKKTWTELSNFFGDIIANSANARNEFLGSIFKSPWEKLTDKIQAAGIKTDQFNDSLMNLAKERGVDIDKFIAEGKTLSDLVSEGIITGDMITETINKFANALGDGSEATGEAAQKLVDLEDVVKRVIGGEFGNGADRVKALTDAGYDYNTVQELVNKTLRGEEVQYEQLSDAQLESLGYTDEQIAAIRDLAEQANAAGTSVSELIADMQKPSGRKLIFESLMNVLKGFGKIIGGIKEEFNAVFKMDTSWVYTVLEGFHKLTEKFADLGPGLGAIRMLFRSVFETIHTVASGIHKFVSGALSLLGSAIPSVNIDIFDMIRKVTKVIDSFNKWISSSTLVTDALGFIRDAMDTVAGWVMTLVDYLNNLWTNLSGAGARALGNTGSTVDEQTGIVKTAFVGMKSSVSGSLDNIKAKIENFSDTTKSKLGDAFGKLGETLSNVFSHVWEILKNIDFKGLLQTILQIVSTVSLAGIAAGLIKIANSFGTVKKSFRELIDGVTGAFKAMQSEIKAKAIKEIAKSVVMLAGSMIVLAAIPQEQLFKAASVIILLFGGLIASLKGLKGLEKISSGGAAKASMAIVAIGIAVMMMAGALAIIAAMDTDKLIDGLIGIIALTMTLTIAMNSLSKHIGQSTQLMDVAAAMIVFAYAIKMVAKATVSLSGVDTNALLGMVVLLASIYAFIKKMSKVKINPDKIVAVAGAMNLIGTALLIMSLAVRALGSIDQTTLGMGLLSIAGILIAVGAFLKAFDTGPSPQEMMGAALALDMIAGGILVMSGAIYALGSINYEALKQGFIAFAGILAAITIFLKLTESVGVDAAASIAVLAMSLLLIVPAIILLGVLPWEVVALGLGAIAGAFIILGAAGLALKGVAVEILMLAGSIFAIGAAAALFGVGAYMVAKAMVVAAGAMVAFTAAVMGSLTIIIGAAALIEEFVVTIAHIFVSGLSTLLQDLLNMLIINLPLISKTVIVALRFLIETVLASLVNTYELILTYLPKLIELGSKIVIAMMDGIAEYLPGIVESAVNLILAFIESVTKTLADNAQRIADAVVELIFTVLDVLVRTLLSFDKKLFEAAGELWNSGFVKGIRDKFSDAWDAVKDFFKDLKKKITDKIEDMKQIGRDLWNGLINGIKDTVANIGSTIKGWGDSLIGGLKDVLGIHSPSKKTAWMGKMLMQGLSNGVSDEGNSTVSSVKKTTRSIIDAMNESLNDTDFNTNPVIAPIMDLSNVKRSIKSLNNMMTGNTMQLAGSVTGDMGIVSGAGSYSNTYQFNQYNNSPKALSRTEIYRQTRNQFSAFERRSHA